jgi:ribosomal protein S27AE
MSDYTKGNTKDNAAEWEFRFVVSDTKKRISGSQIDKFWDRILDAVEEFGLSLGGSYQPILDADYEAMDKVKCCPNCGESGELFNHATQECSKCEWPNESKTS